MKALPWILVLIFLGTAGFLATVNKKNNAEIARLNQEKNELSQAHDALEQAKPSETQNADPTEADKEKQELIRLRNEVGQLRREKQQLAAQAQKAQETSERLLQERQSEQAQEAQRAQQLRQQAPLTTPETEADKARNACVDNLRQINAAKQQWALENKLAADAVPVLQQLTPYFRNQVAPACPSGGVYNLGNLETLPVCSIPGHALSQ